MVDWLFRCAYRSAYQLLRVYWRAMRPHTHGALVAIWCGGKVLLVQNSYLACRSLPGGSVRGGETGRQAAVRELREEIGVSVAEDELRLVVDVVHEWEGKFDHVEIFTLDVSVAPALRIDNREVVHAAFYTPAQALALPLFPPLRRAISARL
ncbi:MAG TPA: NUDIX hydrolase [Polyangia bacterium]